jgi:RNA polymerase sigma-70 factor, ECF subfamily
MRADKTDVPGLIRLAHAGDAQVLGEILALCERRLRVHARAALRADVAGRCDPDDVVQQTLLEAVRGFGYFRGQSEGELLAWLRQILRRNLADVVRSNLVAGKRSAGQESRVSNHPELRSALSSPTRRLARLEANERIERALTLLPPDQRDAVRLRHIEGHTLQEIAGRMERTPVAVASLVKRGMQRLRVLLVEESKP